MKRLLIIFILNISFIKAFSLTPFIQAIYNTQELTKEQKIELITIALIECGGRHKTCPNGKVGEFGGMQLHPKYHNKKQLKNTKEYILHAAKHINKLKNICRSKLYADWVICYNLGPTGSKRIRYPKKFLYYVKFKNNYRQAKQFVVQLDTIRKQYMANLADRYYKYGEN